jgi:hypothetical protein
MGVTVAISVDTTFGGTRYGPAPQTDCVASPGGPCTRDYETGLGAVTCTIPTILATTDVVFLACNFTIPRYTALTLAGAAISYNATCPNCSGPASTVVILPEPAQGNGDPLLSRSDADSHSASVFASKCKADTAAVVAAFPLTVLGAALVVVVRTAHYFVTVRRVRAAAAAGRSGGGGGGSSYSGDKQRYRSSGSNNTNGGASSGARASSKTPAVAVVQGPFMSRGRGLVPLHAWAGVVAPFHLHTAVQQSVILCVQVVAIAAIGAAVMEAAGADSSESWQGPSALGFSSVSLTVVVAICAPIAAAVAVRTPLHLLLMWHRIRDRRYYVKSFEQGSQRYAARVHAAALWAALPTHNERGAPSRFRPEDETRDAFSPAPAGAAATPSGSAAESHESHPSDAIIVAFNSDADKTALAAAHETNFSPRRTRLPTRATHVRVSAETGRAFAFALTVAVAAIAGGFVTTKGWCAAAQRRYNVALVAALVVDALVVSPLWIGAVYAYRVLMTTSRRP